MKTKKLELDVDYIGGQGPLTESEEKALSEYFKKHKLASDKPVIPRKTRKVKRTREAVK